MRPCDAARGMFPCEACDTNIRRRQSGGISRVQNRDVKTVLLLLCDVKTVKLNVSSDFLFPGARVTDAVSRIRR